MSKLYLILCLLLLAYSSTEYLPRGMKLKWYFPDADTVTFEFWIPQSTLDPYDWIGLGLQDSRDSRDNFRCDYYNAIISDGVFDDRYTENNELPPTDEEQGGTNDLTSSRSTVDSYEVFVFTRLLITGDAYDIELEYGRPVLLKWVLGNLDANGDIQQHTMDDMGFEYLVLTDNYEDRNHDERGKFGPYLELPPEDSYMLPEVQNEAKKDWSEYLEDTFGRPEQSSVGEYVSLPI